MSINLKSTETGYQTISDAIAALPAAGDTIIIRNETVSQSTANGVDKKLVWDVADTTFDGNTPPGTNGYGGAIDITGNMLGNTFTRTTFSNNTAPSGSGAIFVRKGASVTMTDVTFTNNSAANGGAIYSNQDVNNFTINGAIFRGNKATNGNGGAIRNDKVLYLGNAEFYDNSCTKNGSAIFNGGTIYVTGKLTLGAGQTIYNNGVIQFIGNSFLTEANTLAKAVDTADAAWLGNKAVTVTSGYKTFTAADNDLYITNAQTLNSAAAMAGDYAAVINGVAYYGTHSDDIAGASADMVVVHGYTATETETLGAGKTMLIAASEIGNITFAGNNTVMLTDKTVKFTAQDLSGVTVTVNGSFGSGEYTIATGIEKLPAVITVNGTAVTVNGAGLVSADGKSIMGVSLNDGILKYNTADTITIVQSDTANGFDTFSTLEAAQNAYTGFTGKIKYDITAYNGNWTSAEATPAEITVNGKTYKLVYGENAFSSISNARNACAADGMYFYYDYGIYNINLADVPTTLYRGAMKANKYLLSAGANAKKVDITLCEVDTSVMQNVLIGQDTDVVSGDWSTTLLNMETVYVDNNHRGYIYASNGTVHGNVTITLKDSSISMLCARKSGDCDGNITTYIENSIIDSDAHLLLGSSEKLAKNVTYEVSGSTIAARILTTGGNSAVVDGDITVNLTDSFVGEYVLLSYGDTKSDAFATVKGNASVTLAGSTVGGVVRSREDGVVLGAVSVTAASGDSEAFILESIDQVTIKKDAALTVDTLMISGITNIALENGAVFTVKNVNFAENAVLNFTDAAFDLSDTVITVDICSDGQVLATGVNKLGAYTLADDTFALTLADGTVSVSKMAESVLSGGTFEGTGSNLVTSGEADVFIAGRTGNAGKLLTTIKGGRINNVVGGAWAKAENGNAKIGNSELNIGGEADIKGQVYAGGYFYGLGGDKAATAVQMTVDEVNIKLDGKSKVSGNLFAGIHARECGNAKAETVNITVTAGTHGRIYAGGWAEKGAVSSVTISNVTISGGAVDYLYGAGANADGNTYVGTSNITISGDAVVNTIFMGGRYGYSYVDTVNLTFAGDDKVLNRLSGVSSAGMDYAKETIVELGTNVTADLIDYVDKFIINENCTLTANNEFYLGNRVEGGAEPGVTTFDFITDGLDKYWTAVAGISDFTNAQFSVNGGEAKLWDGASALAIDGYELTYDAKDKTIKLAQITA